MIETISCESLEERDRYLKKGFAEEFAEMASAVSRAICSGKRIVCVSSYEQMQKYVKNGYINVMLSGFLPELSNYTLEKGPYSRILRRWQRIQTKQ